MSYVRSLIGRSGGNRDVRVEAVDDNPNEAIIFIRLRDVTIEIAADFTDAPRVCPSFRVISPVFQFDGRYPVRPSGLVVINGLTPNTWKGGDVTNLLYNALSSNTPRARKGIYPGGVEVKQDRALLYFESESLFNFNYVTLSVDSTLVGNQVATSGNERYLLIESLLGIKTVCENSHSSDGVRVSKQVMDNLLGVRDVRTAALVPIRGESITLRALEGQRPDISTTDSLNNYTVVTSGDVVVLKGGKYLVSNAIPQNTILLVSEEMNTELSVKYL